MADTIRQNVLAIALSQLSGDMVLGQYFLDQTAPGDAFSVVPATLPPRIFSAIYFTRLDQACNHMIMKNLHHKGNVHLRVAGTHQRGKEQVV